MKDFLLKYFLLLLVVSLIFSKENKLKNSSVQLLSSNIFSSELVSDIENYRIIEQDGVHNVLIEGGTPIIELGSPNLPKLTSSIIIPDTYSMSLNIIEFEFEEFENINILPSKGNLSRDINPSSVPFTFGEVYNIDDFYPSELASISEPFIIRDKRGLTITFNPIQYNPISKKLRIYNKIRVSIDSDNTNGNNILLRGNSPEKKSKEFAEIYDNLFINSRDDFRFNYLDDYGSMLVISDDSFLDQMQEFVIWKNRKGLQTHLVSISEIGNNVNSMQEYINNYYYENDLSYLLLVGDISQIPTHIVNGAASDPTFGFIEGGDSFAEVIVGRFSANNPSELQTQIDRTIAYEKNPPNSDYFNNAIGIGSNQGPGFGGLSDDEFNDLLWNDFLSNYTYDNYLGVYDPSGTEQQALDAINNGVGIINYTGHAGPTGWGNGAALNVNDVNNLENVNKLPFIFTVGCNPGEFNNYGESFCEAWMRATDDNGNPVGSIAHIGSTISQSWEPPMHGQWAMNSILTESYDNNLSRSFGGIAVNGCMHMNEAQGSYGINETNHWTIFGDPSVMIRTDEPSQISASYNNAIFVGQTEFVIDVGVDGVLGALSSNGQLLSSSVSSGGVIVFDLSNITLNPGSVDLVITSFNSIPIEDTINIGAPDGAYLVYHDYNILGNEDNNQVSYGDFVEMNLEIENIGNLNTNAVSVQISSDDPYITLTNNESIFSYALMNEVSISEGNPFSFSVSNSIPDNHTIYFQANLDDGENQWNFGFGIIASAPVFEINNLVLQDDGLDGVWDAGEVVTINVELVNSGSAGFGWYPGATIQTDSPYITILTNENENTFYGIDSNTTYQGSFQAQSSIDTPPNTNVEFNISWGYSVTASCESLNESLNTDGCIEQANLTYSYVVGHPSIIIWDPSDNNNSGQRLTDYFDSNGISGYDYITTIEVPELDNYLTAFILLGMYPGNFVLQENNAQQFVEFLNNGKNIYMESNDTWAFDMQTTLQPMFGLLGVSDGTGDLSSVVGSDGTFAEGLSMTYNGENSFIDQLAPSGGFALLENDIANYITAIAYENQINGYKTVGASHEIAGLQGDDFNLYIEGILNFFDNDNDSNPDPECPAGDIDQDGFVDVTDIIRVVNIIINSGFPPSETEICSADVNSDDQINVLDVLILINVIIDAPRQRSSVIPEAKVILEKNEMNISTNSKVKGIQFEVISSGNLEFNDDLEMDISYNKIEDRHYGLIYSLEGNYIDLELFNLFNLDAPFILKEIIIANNLNQKIENVILNDYVPSVFKLNQNYPNPFNPITNIDFIINQDSDIKLTIHDIAGNLVKTLVDKKMNQGSYSYTWNGNNDSGFPVSSGIYIYTLQSSNFLDSKRMILLK